MTIIPFSTKDLITTLDDNKQLMLYDPTLTVGDRFQRIKQTDFQQEITPARVIRVKSEADLVARFGANIEIPNGESYEIRVDESFTLSLPIKLGLVSALRLVGSPSSITLTYTGTGALIRNTNPADAIGSFDLRDIRLMGGLLSAITNSAFDLFSDTANSFFFIATAQLVAFDTIGIVDMELLRIRDLGMFVFNQGFTIKSTDSLVINVVEVSQAGYIETGMTAFSFIQTKATLIILDDIRGKGLFASDSLVFFDSNAPAGTNYIIKTATKNLGNLFQPGVAPIVVGIDQAVGSGSRLFQPTHGLVKGQVIVLSGFTVEPSYNGTFRVTDIIDANFIEVDVPFVGEDVVGGGRLTTQSLNSTDVPVLSDGNPGEPDSMFTGDAGLEIFGAEITVTINTVDVPEVITSASWAYSGLERFTGTGNEGELTAKDISTRKYSIGYSATIEKQGGSAGNLGIVLLKNGSIVGFNPPHSVNSGKIQITGIDIIELTENDILQVAVINYDDTSDVIVSQVSLVVNLA